MQCNAMQCFPNGNILCGTMMCLVLVPPSAGKQSHQEIDSFTTGSSTGLALLMNDELHQIIYQFCPKCMIGTAQHQNSQRALRPAKKLKQLLSSTASTCPWRQVGARALQQWNTAPGSQPPLRLTRETIICSSSLTRPRNVESEVFMDLRTAAQNLGVQDNPLLDSKWRADRE